MHEEGEEDGHVRKLKYTGRLKVDPNVNTRAAVMNWK